MQEMPSAASGATYCHLVSTTADSLFSLNELYLRANGACISQHFHCTRNGSLQIYPLEGCNGVPETWNLNLVETEGPLLLASANATTKTSSALIGSVKANFVVIQDAENSVIWTTFYPAYLNAPDPTHYSYYLALVFYSLAVLGTIQIGLLYSYRYVSRIWSCLSNPFLSLYTICRFYKGRTVFMLGYMLSQFFWLIWICLDAYLLFSIIPDFDVSHMLGTARDCLLGICTLLSVFITANILLILTQKYSVKNQIITMILLCCLQFGLSGSLYLSPLLPKNTTNLFWRKLIPVWVFFFYFFDLSPPIYVFFKSYQLYPKNRRNDQSYSLFKKYARFVGILLLLQFLNAFWYLAMFYIANFTTILGNDKYLLAMDGAFAFSYVFHSLVTCILNHHMRAMLTLATKIQNQEALNYPLNGDGGSSRRDEDEEGFSSTIQSGATYPGPDHKEGFYYEEEYDVLEDDLQEYDQHGRRYNSKQFDRKYPFDSIISAPEPVHSVRSNYQDIRTLSRDMEETSMYSLPRSSRGSYQSFRRGGSGPGAALYENARASLSSKEQDMSDHGRVPSVSSSSFNKSSNLAHYRYGFQVTAPPVRPTNNLWSISEDGSASSPRLKHVSLVPLTNAAGIPNSPAKESTFSILFNATQRVAVQTSASISPPQ